MDELTRLRAELSTAKAQIATLKAKRREDVRKCEAICKEYGLEYSKGPSWYEYPTTVAKDMSKRIRAAFPEDFQ